MRWGTWCFSPLARIHSLLTGMHLPVGRGPQWFQSPGEDSLPSDKSMHLGVSLGQVPFQSPGEDSLPSDMDNIEVIIQQA